MKDVKFEKEGDKEKPAAEPTPAVDQITEQMQKLNVAEEQKMTSGVTRSLLTVSRTTNSNVFLS
jgi:hypothetical protein